MSKKLGNDNGRYVAGKLFSTLPEADPRSVRSIIVRGILTELSKTKVAKKVAPTVMLLN